MKRRRKGTGTIERTEHGFRPRLPDNGPRLNTYPTEAEAEMVLDAAIAELAAGAAIAGGETLRAWGIDVLDRRERHGRRDIESERSRWKHHIETASFIDWRMRSVTAGDVRAWLDELLDKSAAKGKGHKNAPTRKLARSTVQNTLNLLRLAFEDAVQREHLEVNPAAAVTLPEAEGETHEPWTYLLPVEQSELLGNEDLDDEARDLIAYAIGSGLRQGEQWNLELVDVRGEEGARKVVIRYGSRGRATKGKRIRRVPMFGIAADALERQLARLKHRRNPLGLVWPLPGGTRRQKGEPDWWGAIRPAAKGRHDGRPVRWHDLRHTCASSLVAGWWGRTWSLQEVRDLLGHRSITTTERYAHLAEDALTAAARATMAPRIAPQVRSDTMSKHANSKGSHLRDLNSRPTVYEDTGETSDSESIGRLRGAIAEVSRQALAALGAAVAGSPEAWRLAMSTLTAAVELDASLRGEEAAEPSESRVTA